jgi:hypothetical protein
MQAIGTYSDTTTKDITSKVTWTSSDTTKFTVNSAGVLTGVAVTSTPLPTVKAALGTVSASTTVTVTTATLTSIAIQGGNQTQSIASNPGGFQFVATGTFSDGSQSSVTTSATWSSSDTTVATIQSGATNGGLATLVKAGTTTIKVQQGSVSTNITLTVTN